MFKRLGTLLFVVLVIIAFVLIGAYQGWILIPGLGVEAARPGASAPPPTPAPAPAPALALPASAPVPSGPAPGSELQPLTGAAVDVAKGRFGFTATLLPTGEVLVVGGYVDDTSNPSIELFNPTTGKTEVPGRLPLTAAGASFTLLADGRILIAGGSSAATASRAVLYDPANGKFTVTGALLQGRTGHTATLLRDGRVLIAGGESPAEPGRQEDNPPPDEDGGAVMRRPSSPADLAPVAPVDTAEIYDPASGKFSAAGKLHSARVSHTATLLKDGRVLLAGGINAEQVPLKSAEVFDPARGTFAETGAMRGARYGQTATLLRDGRVLVAGGGDKESLAIDTAELYDPAANGFQPTGNMHIEHAAHSATLLQDGTVLVAGGIDEGGNDTNVAEIYDPAQKRFRRVDGLFVTSSGHSATLLADGSVLIAGHGECELYDPKTSTFSVAARLRTPREAHSAFLLKNGKVLMMGGAASNSGAADSFELYDPAPVPEAGDTSSGAATNVPTAPVFPVNIGGHTATLLKDGRVLIAGGSQGSSPARTEALLYDPQTRELSATGSMSEGRTDASATLLKDGRVLIAGGLGGENSDSTLSSAEIYDPATGTFSAAGRLGTPRTGHSATLLKDGRVLITGGHVEGTAPPGAGYKGPYIPGGASATAEIYDPKRNTFSATGSPTTTRSGSTAVLLGDGKVLVAGGGPRNAAGAEIYDPKQGSFVGTLDVKYVPYDNSALTLPDGRILFVGAQMEGGASFNGTALYDPARRSFITGARIDGTGRVDRALLLKDGRLLVVGHDGALISDPAQMPTEKEDTAPAGPPVMMHAGLFVPTGNMSTTHSQQTATRLKDGRVLIAGGVEVTPDTTAVTDAELYDSKRGTFTQTGPLNTARVEHTATLLKDGRVLIAGGRDSRNGVYRSAELYDPRRGRFTYTGNMTSPRRGQTATLLADGRVLIAGGSIGIQGYSAVLTNSAELFDPSTGTFTPTGSMGEARLWHMATRLPDGRVLIAGGTGSSYGPLNRVEIYDPATGKFSPAGTLSTGRYNSSITLLPDGKVLFFNGTGGAKNSSIGKPEIYDPATGTSTSLGDSADCYHATATTLQDGRVLLISNGCSGIGAAPEADLFDPVTRKFTATARLAVARFDFSATLLSDGKVLVVGGEQGIAISPYSSLASAEVFDPSIGALITYPPRRTAAPKGGN